MDPLQLLLLLALSAVRETVGSPDDQCQFIFKADTVLDVKQSQDNGAQVTGDLHVEDQFKCAEECCSSEGEWCTLAVYHLNTGAEAINCFLVQCVPDDGTSNVCVTKHLRHSGFITAQVSHHIPNHEKSSTTAELTSIATTKATTQAMSADTTPGPKWTSPASLPANQTSDSNATQPITAAHNGTSSPEVIREGSINRTTVTQTGILIVTLCFGIIFLLTMMVVVGKRWCEGYQRRKYSKVDYLINGIYS